MEEIGLELVLQGLEQFTGGLNQAQKSMLDLLQQPSLLEDAFSALGSGLGSFADWIGNTLTYTLGGLLTDAIEGVISLVGDLVQSTIDAGNAFQVLSIRLDGINFNDPTTNLSQFSDGMERAQQLTKDQIKWIQQMAIITPFSAEGIASVYTMQRAMGDSDQQAKDLTVSITNWAAGMGLSEESVLRLSTALGKATSAGKVDGITMRALRSEFVPIPAVLQQMADDLGITTDKLAEMQKTGKLAPEPFIKAFEEVANKRFPDAANALAHTWQGALNNIVDIFANFGGADIVKPILDVLGKVAGGMVDVFAVMTDGGPRFTELGLRLESAVIRIGEALSDIISQILGLLPSTDTIGEALVSAVEGVATWLEQNGPGIVAWVKEIIAWFTNLGQDPFFGPLISDITSIWNWLTQVQVASQQTGLEELASAITAVGTAIAGVLEPFLKPFVRSSDSAKPSLEGFVQALYGVAQWITDNQKMLQTLLEIFIGFEVIQTITSMVFSFIIALVGIIATVAVVLVGALALALAFIGIAGAVIQLTLVIGLLQIIWDALVNVFNFGVELISTYFRDLVNNATVAVANIKDAFINGDWGGLMRAIGDLLTSGFRATFTALQAAFRESAEHAVDGFRDGFFAKWTSLLTDVGNAFAGLVTFIKNLLGIASPSTVFADIGHNMIAGVADGITNATSLAVGAMSDMVSAVTVPISASQTVMQSYMQAAPTAISNTYQSQNSYNLAIHTSGSQENVVADFGMMRALSGV